eukprot:2361219-Prymnesium_polylepis.1
MEPHGADCSCISAPLHTPCPLGADAVEARDRDGCAGTRSTPRPPAAAPTRSPHLCGAQGKG